MLIGVCVLCGTTIWKMQLRITELKKEKATYESNAIGLLKQVVKYRTRDSLNAAKVAVLTLKVSELEEYRAADTKVIETLKIKRKELEQLTTMQTRTIAQLKGRMRDTVIYRDRVIPDTLQKLEINNKWIDLIGLVNRNGEFDGTLSVVDSLTIVQTVQHARFLGFLWKTKKVKSRTLDVTSKNPYTEIVNVSSIIIEK